MAVQIPYTAKKKKILFIGRFCFYIENLPSFYKTFFLENLNMIHKDTSLSTLRLRVQKKMVDYWNKLAIMTRNVCVQHICNKYRNKLTIVDFVCYIRIIHNFVFIPQHEKIYFGRNIQPSQKKKKYFIKTQCIVQNETFFNKTRQKSVIHFDNFIHFYNFLLLILDEKNLKKKVQGIVYAFEL